MHGIQQILQISYEGPWQTCKNTITEIQSTVDQNHRSAYAIIVAPTISGSVQLFGDMLHTGACANAALLTYLLIMY